MSACLTAIQFDQENRFSRRLRLQALEVEFSPNASLPGAGAPEIGSVFPWVPSDLSCDLVSAPETWGSRAAQACGRASREASRLASAWRIWGSLFSASS